MLFNDSRVQLRTGLFPVNQLSRFSIYQAKKSQQGRKPGEPVRGGAQVIIPVL